ncbi:MAG: efflux RND transporter periplasmic adaptor subunit [Actinobacteria bacterium]|nr:efflux RND transporter periplasmic adaptor subunit [Actinomycetota bacterium]
MRRARVFLALGLAVSVTACGRKTETVAVEVVPVLAAKVEKRAVPIELSAIGNVEALQTVAVQARVAGEIDRVEFVEGQDVQPGDLLFTIDPRPYEAALAEAQARLERDRALAKNAEESAARYADLVKKDYVTAEQYEQMRAGGEAARATARADEAAVENARLQLSYTKITAPISGRTGSIQVHKGNMLRPNDERTLVTINQIRPIAVSFTVPESTFDSIRRAQAESKLSVVARPSRGASSSDIAALAPGGASPASNSGAAAGGPATAATPEASETGELSFVDNTVDRATGTVRLKATFANKTGALWPGRFVDVVLTLAHDPDALVIPAEAIQTGQQGSYVFVVKDDSTVESRTVTVGRRQGDNVVIAKGLSADERVVTDGQVRLAPGVKVEVKPAAEVRS